MMIRRNKRKTMSTTNQTAYLGPDLILFHILPRLPAKSLLKFTCVSKLWYNMIHDPNFIASHYNHSKSNPSLVAISGTSREIRFMYLDQGGGEGDQEEEASSLIVNLPNTYWKLLVGYTNGLTCIRTRFFIEICNPSTHEKLCIPYPKIIGWGFRSYGFGFDPLVNEYKVLQIADSDCKIYTVGAGLSSTRYGIWRDITVTTALPQEFSDIKLQSRSSPFIFSSGALFKVIARLNLIIVFDMHYERFQVIPGLRLCRDKLCLYSITVFRDCPYVVYCRVLENGYEFRMYALKQQQQQTSNSCWFIKECCNHISYLVSEQAIHIPFKPDSKLIHFVEFSGQIFLLWVSTKDDHIYVYNPHTEMLRKEVSGCTSGWYYNPWNFVLFVRHIDNLHSLKTLVPLLPLGAPEVIYVSSREEAHDEGNSTQESKHYRPSAEELRQLDMNR